MTKKIIQLILTFIGFGSLVSCNNGGNDVVISCEYGTPHATFSLKGKVTDTEAGNAIPGIRVKVESANDNYFYVYPENANIALTDAEGNYNIILGEVFPRKYELNVNAADIDGKENGTFTDKDIPLIIEEDEYSGGDGWYRGSVEKEINIKMSAEE